MGRILQSFEISEPEAYDRNITNESSSHQGSFRLSSAERSLDPHTQKAIKFKTSRVPRPPRTHAHDSTSISMYGPQPMQNQLANQSRITNRNGIRGGCIRGQRFSLPPLLALDIDRQGIPLLSTTCMPLPQVQNGGQDQDMLERVM